MDNNQTQTNIEKVDEIAGYLSEKQNKDICKKYCEDRKAICFLCIYSIWVPWIITFLAVSIFVVTAIFLGSSLVTGILGASIVLFFLYAADGMGGTKKWPWQIDIETEIYEILSDIDTHTTSTRIILKLVPSFLYKAYANSIIVAIILFVIALIALFFQAN